MHTRKIISHKNPVNSGQKVKIEVTDPSVWMPYSAFHLAEETLPLAKTVARRNNHSPIVADIGTGSGVLAILAKQVIPEAFLLGTDLNSHAVESARSNWKLNGLNDLELTTLVADGIDKNLVTLIDEHSGVDVLIANLPQQPLINGGDLASLRETNSAAWNIDPSRDPDGLGIFISVFSKSHQVMKSGGVAIASASSKQNKRRIKSFLNNLKTEGKIKNWELISATRFDVPGTYDSKLVEHWLEMEKSDGTQRLFEGTNGPQYEHYNLAIHY